jgi:hypothetical protein
VGKILFSKGIIFGIIGIIAFFTLSYASQENEIKLQGKIMDFDLKRNMMTVNERLFVWDEKTIINNEKGSPITMDQFKPKSWVYIVGERDNVNKRIMIKKIYLLPKRVDKKERNLYPFIE